MTDLVLIALGSNLPDRADRSSLETCRWAVATLAVSPGLALHSVSPWYVTRPIPASDQPDYVNGVARFQSVLEPPVLLAMLHAVEAEAGRVRTVPNAARVLDLDLLAVGNRIVASPTLTLPHPRLPERAFVLQPLCDVAPLWRHPELGLTAAELRDRLPDQGVRPMER